MNIYEYTLTEIFQNNKIYRNVHNVSFLISQFSIFY